MAEQYDNTNRFALFKNDKGDNENRPDYTGTINVAGKELRLAAWMKESQAGVKYLSGSIDDPADRQDTNLTSAPPEKVTEDVPF